MRDDTGEIVSVILDEVAATRVTSLSSDFARPPLSAFDAVMPSSSRHRMSLAPQDACESPVNRTDLISNQLLISKFMVSAAVSVVNAHCSRTVKGSGQIVFCHA